MGEKIIESLKKCYSLRECHMNNNLLGVAYDGKEAAICKMIDVL
jgi:hypothetical protein